MKISFDCDSITVLLLIAFYDIVSDVEPMESIAAQDYFDFVIDAIGTRAPEFYEYAKKENNVKGWQLEFLAEKYKVIEDATE